VFVLLPRMEKSHSNHPRTARCVVNMFHKNGISPLRWGWVFLIRTQILSGIQFTTHFIEFFVVETKWFVVSFVNMVLMRQTCGQRSSRSAESNRRALGNCFSERICYMFQTSKFRRDWDLGLCTTSGLAFVETDAWCRFPGKKRVSTQEKSDCAIVQPDFLHSGLWLGAELETGDFFCASVILWPGLLLPRLACGLSRLGGRVSESLLRPMMDRVRQVNCLGGIRMNSYLFFFPCDSLLGSGWGFSHAWEGFLLSVMLGAARVSAPRRQRL